MCKDKKMHTIFVKNKLKQTLITWVVNYNQQVNFQHNFEGKPQLETAGNWASFDFCYT